MPILIYLIMSWNHKSVRSITPLNDVCIVIEQYVFGITLPMLAFPLLF